ncbi:PA2779 family protein [Pseudodesulfovibrio sp.]|uniref:PA2779 family protein n=1 Tax=Pseudodesulfovibrio sp. TaxID=2035812 RepID=UPI002625267D|nr:PA2779 family protein [Pseudodesulfovibrio sp.]MDD3310728.1 PA2779 family protein [Pseudodesulfovibrio sp.]
MYRAIVKWTCYVTIVAMMALNVSVPMARAEMISTETAVSASRNEQNRATVRAFLERDDMRQALVERGVDVNEAQSRIDALSDQEVADLAGKIDSLPAGGSALGMILGVGLIVFVILLITDIAGATDVFPFVKKR